MKNNMTQIFLAYYLHFRFSEKTDKNNVLIGTFYRIQYYKTFTTKLFQIVVCLCGSFSGMFLQSSLETVFTPLSKRLLGFTSVENSVTYVGIGVVAVAGYFRKKSQNLKIICFQSHMIWPISQAKCPSLVNRVYCLLTAFDFH